LNARPQVNAREAKKLADKERLLMEKAHRMREEAMREDDNVFDVAFEGMGAEDATLSATDIKVRRGPSAGRARAPARGWPGRGRGAWLAGVTGGARQGRRG
jgi:hypothetical protein